MNDQEHLIEYLSDRDVACVSCGYSLRGIQHGRCPECNEDLELRVGLAEPRLGAVVAFLAGAWCCAGTTFALLVSMLGLSIYFDDWPPPQIWLPGIIGFVLSAPFAILVGTRDGRSWLRRRSGPVRGLLVAGAWFVFAASVLSFGLLLTTM